MAVFQIPPTVLRLGVPVPFALRDASGHLLVPRGTLLESEAQRQQLLERGVYVDANDSEHFKKALAGKLDSMVRQNATLGQIARAQPDVIAPAAAAVGPARRVADPIGAWNGLLLRASSLLTLIHSTTNDTHAYSVTHAMLVAAVCELAARHVPGWPADWRAPLRRAALTMNIAMTALQDHLATQDEPPTPRQRELIDSHAARAAAQLRELGVADELWLQAVQHHHASPPGPLAELPAMMQLARLIQRADIFAARLSPRKLRQALSASAAAKAAYLDEHQKPDEAGAAIIKALGIYPPGSYVRLASMEVAVVVRRGRRANEPKVASILSRSGTPLGEPALRDTRLKGHEITGGVPPHEVKVRLNLARLMVLA